MKEIYQQKKLVISKLILPINKTILKKVQKQLKKIIFLNNFALLYYYSLQERNS